MGKLEKYIGTKLPKGLYEILEEYKRERQIKSDSEALRDIVRRFLLDVWQKEKLEEVVLEEG